MLAALSSLEQLLWYPETDAAQGLYRCRNSYCPPKAQDEANASTDLADALDDWDDDEAYDYA